LFSSFLRVASALSFSIVGHVAFPSPLSSRIVVPNVTGSIGHNGRPYEWVLRDELADAPRWLVESLKPSAQKLRAISPQRWVNQPSSYGLVALAREVAAAALAAEGNRNDRLFYAACRLGELEAGGELPRGSARQPLIESHSPAGRTHVRTRSSLSPARTPACSPRTSTSTSAYP
jgi:hypothetical protein